MGNSVGNAVGNSAGNTAGNSAGNLAGISAGISVGNSTGNLAGTLPKLFLKPIFKICKSSRSTSFSLVKIKYSLLKPILNGFSHMTHQIKA